MLRPLLPHQETALAWAQDRPAIALFLQMRLGKSAIAIRWAKDKISEASQGGALVIAPLTTLKGWEEELKREGETDIVWLAGLTDHERTVEALMPRRWFLINYEAVRVWKAGYQIPWSVVILDESTKIKNAKSKITKVITGPWSFVEHRAILTGLPNPEGLMDFYPQMQFVNGGSFMGFHNFWAWREALFFESGYDWVPRRAKDGKPSTRERVKDAVKELSFIMSRKEANVGSRLFHEKRTVPMVPIQKKAWNEVKKKFALGDLQTKSAGAQFVWLQRIAGGFGPDRANPALLSDAKLEEIRSLLLGELRREALVVWFHFNEELAYVYHSLKADGYRTGALLGDTPVPKRHLRQKKFASGEIQVFCVQEELGKFGLDFSVADTEIYYSNSWSYETRAQSQDRLVHPLKTTPLLAIDLVTEGTTDEDVVETLQEKGVDANSFNGKLLAKVRARLEQTTT